MLHESLRIMSSGVPALHRSRGCSTILVQRAELENAGPDTRREAQSRKFTYVSVQWSFLLKRKKETNDSPLLHPVARTIQPTQP